MPTGYTAAIAEGITFKDFVMQCARNFGALIDMREDPIDAKIPNKFEPSSYYKDKVKEIEADIANLMLMSIAQAAIKATEEYEEAINIHIKGIKKNNDLLYKYNKMLSKVKAWNPPTVDHINLKEFMINQIEESIKYDCDNSYYENNNPILHSGDIWKVNRINKLTKDLNYYQKKYLEEVNSVNEKNIWISQLRKSLKIKDYE